MIALRALSRRALARRPAAEAAVAAGDDGRPDASLGKPASGRLPSGLPQRLGRRFATTTATWKTPGVFHSYLSPDDYERCTKIELERRHRNTPFDRSKGTLRKRGLSLSPEHPSVPFRRNRCPFSSVSATTNVKTGVQDSRDGVKTGPIGCTMHEGLLSRWGCVLHRRHDRFLTNLVGRRAPTFT